MELHRPIQALCPLISLSLLAGLVLLGGCDLFSEEDTTIRATGTVVLTESGEFIEGLNVILIEDASGIGGYKTVKTTTTDASGRFALNYDDVVEQWGYNIRINAEPYDSDYTSRLVVVQPGETRDLGVIELERTED
jgi:hypothetical protein